VKKLLIALFLFVGALPIAAQESTARLFETISHELPCGDAEARLDVWFTELTGNLPDAKGVAIYYEGDYLQAKYTRGGEKISEKLVAPVFGEAQERIRWLQLYTNFRGFPRERLEFIFGGYRTTFAVDLWLVPGGAAYPTPEPNVDRMKFRPGKFTYFSCV
jgi:hypothetical protein